MCHYMFYVYQCGHRLIPEYSVELCANLPVHSTSTRSYEDAENCPQATEEFIGPLRGECSECDGGSSNADEDWDSESDEGWEY